jgi:hypothetical protein
MIDLDNYIKSCSESMKKICCFFMLFVVQDLSFTLCSSSSNFVFRSGPSRRCSVRFFFCRVRSLRSAPGWLLPLRAYRFWTSATGACTVFPLGYGARTPGPIPRSARPLAFGPARVCCSRRPVVVCFSWIPVRAA